MPKEVNLIRRSLMFCLFGEPYTVDDLIYLFNTSELNGEKEVYIIGNASYSPIRTETGSDSCTGYEVMAYGHFIVESSEEWRKSYGLRDNKDIGEICLYHKFSWEPMDKYKEEQTLLEARAAATVTEKKFKEFGIRSYVQLNWKNSFLSLL
jgi:hypothetical protein